MAGQYWFPSMSHEEIVDSFSEWGISINPHDLKRPTSEFVTTIYYACLQQVTTLSADGLQGAIQRELAKLENSVCPPSPGFEPYTYLSPCRTSMLLPWHIISFYTICEWPSLYFKGFA